MTNLTRKNQKVFASGASNNGQFGSLQATTKVLSNDVETLQALAAYESGWNSAVVSGEQLPSLEEFQGLNYINTYQIGYLLQKGFPEWNTDTTYYIGDLAREVGGTKIYKSITDSNSGNALTDTTNWQLKLDLDSVASENNVIINGDMEISQRGTSFAAISDNDYSLDRFIYQKGGSMVHTITQDTDVPTFAQAGRLLQNSLKIDCTTIDSSIGATDLAMFGQQIEGYNFLEIAQKTFTIGFWVKGTKTGIHCVSFRNSGLDRSYVDEYTINTTNTWEYKTITVPASPSAGTWDYTNGVGLSVRWALAMGSNRQTTAGSWQTGNYNATSNQVNACDSTSNNFWITGVQIVKGAVDTEPRRRSFGEELALSQRYYEKSYSQSINPGTATAIGQTWIGVGTSTTGTLSTVSTYKVEKRATPSVTLYDLAGNSGQVTYDSSDNETGTVSNSGTRSFRVATDNSTSKQSFGYQYVSGAEL